MKQRNWFYTMAFFLIFGIMEVQALPVPDGRRLKDIVADKFPGGNVWIGCAAHGASILSNEKVIAILDREFSYVTPANDFKQSYIHPNPETWNWDLPKMWVKRAVQKGQILRAHAPIGPQASTWAREDERSPAELQEMIGSFMREQCRYYQENASVIRWLDVINETVESSGEWKTPKSGTKVYENPWPLTGYEGGEKGFPLYIRQAFEVAGANAPGVKFIINQDSFAAPCVEKLRKTVLWLRGQGLRVDGIGYQFHIASGWETNIDRLARFEKEIDWAHDNRLEFHVTEFQSYLSSDAERKVKAAYPPEERKERLAAQAETTSVLLRALLKKRTRGVVAMNFWHLFDSETAEKDGNLFEEDGQPRPAYYAVQKLLENPPN